MTNRIKGIRPAAAVGYAISLTLSEAVANKLIDYDTMIKLTNRADSMYDALLRGDVLDPQPDGTVKIRKRPEVLSEEELSREQLEAVDQLRKAVEKAEASIVDPGDTLVIGGKPTKESK